MPSLPGVLGIGTLSLAPYAVVTWATPLVLIASASLLSRRDVIPTIDDPDDVHGAEPGTPPRAEDVDLAPCSTAANHPICRKFVGGNAYRVFADVWK